MTYDAKILADSLSPEGVRLTTMQITFPRFILAEFNTHAFSRNSASSRAIPVEKRIAAVQADPFVPEVFGRNKRGMQAGDALESDEQVVSRDAWLRACARAVECAHDLAEMGVHKQHANRLLEPFAWHTVICTATDWRNFFALRCSPMAQPEIRTIAEMMRDVLAAGRPKMIGAREWHLPLVDGIDADELIAKAGWRGAAEVAAARCARVSYLTHEGRRDHGADFELAAKLLHDGHVSPYEHAARPPSQDDVLEQLERLGVKTYLLHSDQVVVDMKKFKFGKLRGWVPLRWTIPNEAVFGGGEP